MESSKFWVNTIIEQQVKAPGGIWQNRNVQAMIEAYTSSKIFRHNKAIADDTNAAWDIMFTQLRTSEAIIQNWEMVGRALGIF
jgi:hypothetical protein